MFESVAFEDWVDFCPRNVDEEGELEERWYLQRLESGKYVGQLNGVQAEAWGRQD